MFACDENQGGSAQHATHAGFDQVCKRFARVTAINCLADTSALGSLEHVNHEHTTGSGARHTEIDTRMHTWHGTHCCEQCHNTEPTTLHPKLLASTPSTIEPTDSMSPQSRIKTVSSSSSTTNIFPDPSRSQGRWRSWHRQQSTMPRLLAVGGSNVVCLLRVITPYLHVFDSFDSDLPHQSR